MQAENTKLLFVSLGCIALYFLNRFHLYLLLFACSSSKTCCEYLPPPHQPTSALYHSTTPYTLGEEAIFMLSLQAPSLQIWLLLLSPKHPFISVERDLASQMSETNFFPLRRKSNASVYKTLCVWLLFLLLWIEMYLFLYFTPLSGFEVSLTNGSCRL